MVHVEIWKFLAGLGFFLYGMNLLETVLKNVAGRSTKLFLKRNTTNLFKSIGGGAILTAIVQSSSVVALIVLAFVESGIITFRQAMGIILGSNVGTTLTGWIVATVGFNVNILNYSLPTIAISAICMFFFERRKNLHHVFTFFFSLGILFLGLAYMKEGASQLVLDFDIKTMTGYHSFVFVLLGFVLTTIIQSSSATTAIALTAIYAGVLTFPTAAAMVIGSEVGTTIKILFWGMTGTAGKKRVAWGNFVYNIFTATMAYLFLRWFIYFIEIIVGIQDPLIGLVFFQTAINLLSMIVFLPFINLFSRWFESKFVIDSSTDLSYFNKHHSLLPLLAVETLKNETVNLFKKTLLFNRNILCDENAAAEGLLDNLRSLTRAYTTIDADYARLKQTEGDILGYYASIQESNLRPEDTAMMLQYLNAARQSVYAAKAVKDIIHNLEEFGNSSNDLKYAEVALIHQDWIDFEAKLLELLPVTDAQNSKSAIDTLNAAVLAHEEKQKIAVLYLLKSDKLSEVEASTMMNVHRELLSCKKSLLLAVNALQSELFTKIKFQS